MLKKKLSRRLLTFLFKILFLLCESKKKKKEANNVREIIVVEQEDNACFYASMLQGHFSNETGPDSQTSTLSLWSRIMSLSKTANPTNFTVCNTKIITLWQHSCQKKNYYYFSISETLHFFVFFDIHKLVKCSDYWWGPVLNWVHQSDHTESKWWVLIFWHPKHRQCDLLIKDKSFYNT